MPTAPISTSLRPDAPTVPSLPAAPVGVPTIAVPPGVGRTSASGCPREGDGTGPGKTHSGKPRAAGRRRPPWGRASRSHCRRPRVPRRSPSPNWPGMNCAGNRAKAPGPPEGTWTPAAGQPKLVNQPGAMRPGNEPACGPRCPTSAPRRTRPPTSSARRAAAARPGSTSAGPAQSTRRLLRITERTGRGPAREGDRRPPRARAGANRLLRAGECFSAVSGYSERIPPRVPETPRHAPPRRPQARPTPPALLQAASTPATRPAPCS